MIPRYHIILGALFTALVWYFAPDLNVLYLILIFLSSFLIDFDHYIVFSKQTKSFSLPKAIKHANKLRDQELKDKQKGVREKGHMYLFHTIEFHILVAALGVFWQGFFYIFIGMVFHSLLDVADLLVTDRFYRREYFLFNWLRKKLF